MKHLGKLAVLGAVLAASAPFASADNILIGSYAGSTAPAGNTTQTATVWTGFQSFVTPPTGTPNPFAAPTSGGGATGTSANLNPESSWSAALPNSTWVGINSQAGPAGGSQTTTNPPYGYYTFTSTFTALGGLYNGSLTVQADDTTEVFLNGVNVTNEIIKFGDLGTDIHCADNVPSCLNGTATVNLSDIMLNGGLNGNTLTFVVEQAGDEKPGLDPSGVDYDATFSTAATPEPNSLILLGTGLLGAAGMLVRKRQTV